VVYLTSPSTSQYYRGADKSLARPTSRCILFDVENISFDASLVIYINSTNIPPIMIIRGLEL
jgi:homoserine trans-succinylase